MKIQLKRLKDWGIFSKLIGFALLLLFPFVFSIWTFLIPFVNKNLYQQKTTGLKNLVESVFNLISEYERRVNSGEFTLEEAQKRAMERIRNMRYNTTDYFWINDLQPKMIMHPINPKLNDQDLSNYKDPNGKMLFIEMVKVCRENGEGVVEYFWPKPGEELPVRKLSYVKVYHSWGWIVGTGVYIDDLEKELASLKNSIVILIAVAILISIALAFLVAFRFIKPIKTLKNAAERVASGETDVIIKDYAADEIGLLTAAFNKMVLSINSSVEEIKKKNQEIQNALAEAEKHKNESQQQHLMLESSVDRMLLEMNKFSKGDLNSQLEITGEDTINKLYSGFNLAVENINKILQQVSASIAATSSAANQISGSTEEMSAGGTEQSQQINEIAGAIEEMTKTIFENTRNASLSAESAKTAGDKAREGGDVIKETIIGINKISEIVIKSAATIDELGRSSNQIGEIVEVIDDIADQTNLLALNAAIEAARAGEQGRGFAVVADEVRKLAERTTKATKEIATMIKTIQENTKGAVESIKTGTIEVETGKLLANKAEGAISGIIEQTSKVSDVIRQVAAASEQQSATSEEISKNVEAISSVIQQSAQGIQQIAKAAEDLNRLTVSLHEQISNFKLRGTQMSFNQKIEHRKFFGEKILNK